MKTSRSPSPAREAAWRGSNPFLSEVLAGLAQHPRALPSRWFYDARGSQLFQWITNLPGYYLTRVEREILAEHADALLAPLPGPDCTVVDLGAGDGHKTHLLLRRLAGRAAVTYAPVDVSEAALEEAGARVRQELPAVRVRPVQAGWGEALARLARAPGGGARLVLFLGSSVGNLEQAEAIALLRQVRRALRPGDHLLIGFDLVKPLPLLLAAYDDPQGVTRAFNLNLIQRMNRELGTSLDLEAFRHRALWDPVRPAMESWLELLRPQEVRLAGRVVRLAAGERIRTEISCKYTGAQISALAAAARFTEVARFQDARGWFADALWSAG